MKQYCRYCAHCHYADDVYCDIKNGRISESKAKAVNHCKDFEFNEIDVFYAGDMTKVYKPKEPKKTQCDGQMKLFEKG